GKGGLLGSQEQCPPDPSLLLLPVQLEFHLEAYRVGYMFSRGVEAEAKVDAGYRVSFQAAAALLWVEHGGEDGERRTGRYDGP
ncbi:hypothetical protein OFB93_30585, partial [Escherichia coli]|nr:hypothetical protein [Escherichia coli]